MRPTLLLLNGRIHTLDEAHPRATALALQGERILAVGSDDEVLTIQNSQSIIQNLNGRTVLPGLTDSHLHFEWYSLGLRDVDVRTDSKDGATWRVRERAAVTPRGKWIF